MHCLNEEQYDGSLFKINGFGPLKSRMLYFCFHHRPAGLKNILCDVKVEHMCRRVLFFSQVVIIYA